MSSLDQERVQQLKEHIENGRHPDSFIPEESELDTGLNHISVAECLRIRERYENPETSLRDIVDSTEWEYETIRRHINSECEHENITKRQCNAIRCAAQDGHNASEVASLFSFLGSRHIAHDHATGDCNHDDGVDPVMTTEQISDADCRRMRSQYRTSDMSQRDIADAVGHPRGTVGYHLSGACTHD